MSSAHPHATPDRPLRRPLTLEVWRNPLARSTDRAQATVLILMTGIWLLAFPVVAAAGSGWWPEALSAAAEQQRTRMSTPAVLTADATDFAFSARGIPVSGQVPVPARWVAPDGSERTGTISTAGGAKSGDIVRIWADRSGNITAAPMSSAGAAIMVILAAFGAWLTVGALLGVCWLIVRWRLKLRRFEAWDRDWLRVEPHWSGRQP